MKGNNEYALSSAVRSAIGSDLGNTMPTQMSRDGSMSKLSGLFDLDGSVHHHALSLEERMLEGHYRPSS